MRNRYQSMVAFLMLVFASRADASRTADEIVAASGIQGGLVVHVNCGDGKLTAALYAGDSYVVQGLGINDDDVRRAREHVRSLGLYGPVTIDAFDGKQLPYVDNLVNLLVVGELGSVTMDEVMRVLAPQGVAWVDGRKTVKVVPPEIDEWTHWLHGPDGNAVADDRVVGPPRCAQWIAEPQWQRHHEASPSVSAMVTSSGRIFAIINQAPAGIDGLPDRWALVARDAFNGKLLWTRSIDQWGSAEWSDHSYGNGRWNHPTNIARRLVAVGDRVYVTLGFNAPVTALDAATGRTVMTYPKTESVDEILYHDGTLVLSVSSAPLSPGKIKDAAPAPKSVVALDAETGVTLWHTDGLDGAASKADAIERITQLLLVAGGDAVYGIEEDAVVALDLKTGKIEWRYDRGTRPRAVTYGSYYLTNMNSMVYHDGVVLFMEPKPTTKRMPYNSPTKCMVLGLDAQTGRVLWERPSGFWGHYGQGDLFVIDRLAWVHDLSGFSMVGLDPRTGEVVKRVSTREALDQGHHHRCYRNKATTRYIITGRRGAEFIDMTSGDNLRHHWVRGTCRYGVLPANGLLYAPPHPCVCYITAKLNGFWSLAPARTSSDRSIESKEMSVLQKGPQYGAAVLRSSLTGLPPTDDWPTFRHDVLRTGSTSMSIPAELKTRWSARIDGKLTQPVIAGARVYVASVEEHRVQCLDANNGRLMWSYTAGARVDTPPTIFEGLALFGSADGWVYCLQAADGQLVWRRRIAPEERRMMSHDQLESVWPLHGSVLIQRGVAYVIAGRSSFLDDGLCIAALDPMTGRLIRSARINSLDPKTGDMVEALMYYDMPPDALGALPDILVGGDKYFYLRHLKIDSVTLEYSSASRDLAKVTKRTGEAARKTPAATNPKSKKKPATDPTRRARVQMPVVVNHLMSTAGLLDDSWFNQTYWTIDGAAHSKLLVFDNMGAYGVKPYRGTARHSRAIFRPGTTGYTLFAEARPKHAKRWSMNVPMRIVGMVLAGPTLFIAGSPDRVDPQDPWAAIDGQRGGLLWAVSAKDGQSLAEYRLDVPPAYDGLAVAGGKLYVSLADGNIVCFGGE